MATRRRDLVEIISDHERQIRRMQATLARVGSGGAGVTDHGGLTGLTDDDHGQYLTNARGDARYSLLAHGHALDLEDLDDVTLTGIVGDEILKWNGTQWINNTLAEAGIAAAADLHTKYTDGEAVSAVGTPWVGLIAAEDHHTKYTNSEADARIALHDAIVDAHHTKYTDGEVDAIVLTHKNLSSAHHSKYTDGEVDAIVLTHKNLASAHHSKYTDGEVDAIVLTHKNLASAHHTKYTDGNALTAMGVLTNSNTYNHNRYLDSDAVSAVGTPWVALIAAEDHHTKYTDSEVDAIVLTHKNLTSAHHTKYTDGNAVSAMGALGNGNALNHTRYSDANAVSAVGTPWVGLIAAEDHHTKYTNGEAVSAMGATSNSNTLRHNRYTDSEVDSIVLTHKNLASAHHTKYTDGNAVSAVGTPWLSAHTMTGLLTLSGVPSTDLHAATKKYVDDAITGSGGYVDPLTTKGDLLGFDTDTSRVPVGSNNQVLTADSGQVLGVKWSTPHTKYLDSEAVTAVGTPWVGLIAAEDHHTKYTDASAAAKIAADDLYVKVAGDTMTGPLLADYGSASAPGIAFDGDPDTGLWRFGSNSVLMLAGGSITMRWQFNGVYSDMIRDLTTGSNANVFVNLTSGQLVRSTSARKYKSRIDYNMDYLADIDLRPTKFYRKDDGEWFIGFIADDLADEEKLLGVYNGDGEIENFDQRAVMAVMAAKINRLDAQVKELQGQR